MSPRQHKQFSGGKTVFRAEVNGLSVMFFFQYWYEFDIFGFKLHVSSCLRQYSNVTISIFQKQKSSVSLRLVNSTYLIKWHENVPKPTVLEFFIQKYHSIFQLLQNSFFTSHKSSSQVWGVQFDIQLITNSILCYSDHCSDCGNRSDVFCSSGGDSVIRVCSRKSASQTAHCLLQGHNVHVLLQTYSLALIIKCTYQL